MLKQDAKVEWTLDAKQAFEEIKKAIADPPS